MIQFINKISTFKKGKQMKTFNILLIIISILHSAYQENQNLIFFDYPMIWTKYVILTGATYQGNQIYTYNVPIDGTNVTNITTGVSLAGFTSLVTQSFNFRINEYFQTGIQSYITLNWTVIYPSAFNYLSFTILILQNDAQYLEIIKNSYINPSGLYSGTGTALNKAVVSTQTKYNLVIGTQIYNFITSIQSLLNKAAYAWPQQCCNMYGCWICAYTYTWDWQDSYTISGINDINHIWVQYVTAYWTRLYQIYSIHIIFYGAQYNKDHLYPFIIDYIDNFLLNSSSTLIYANLNARYGPNYNQKCLFGQNQLLFGRFYPSLRFSITPTGFANRGWYEQYSQVQYYTDFTCVTGFRCDYQIIGQSNFTNSTNSSNETNVTNEKIINNFYFPAYKNCSSCNTKIIGANSCNQVEYCINCVAGFDIPNNQTCIFCLACDHYAYVLSTGYCQACNITFQGCFMCITDAYASCTKCFEQYFLNASLCYLCNTTMILCITCNSSSICTQCYSPDNTYYLNTTTHICTLCSSTLSHCFRCQNNTACIQCESDQYYIDPITLNCNPCNTSNTFCATCINQTFCLTCYINYNMDENGTCQFCDFYTSNCTQCTNDTTCTNCSLSYFLDYENQCKVCSQFITGCYLCDNNQTCQDCYEDYVLKTDELCYYCALFIDKCFKCKNETFCTNCVYGYYVNDNHTCTDCDIPMNHCVDCVVSDLCLDCSYGFYPNASECLLCKSQMTECIDCVNSTFCLVCTSDFIPINGTCQCRHGYLVTEMCNIILGCVSNHNISGVKRCLACNAAANFSYSNFNCSCKEGYQISGVWQDAVCVEKCGDGRLIYLACDDGNLFDGDGCSSKCMIEPGYYCQNGSFWSASVCELIVEFSVSLYSIKRDDSANSGVIKLQISPVKSQLKGAQWTNYITVSISEPKPSTASPSQPSKLQTHFPARLLNTPVSIKITDITYNQGIVSINFDYFESIQNFNTEVEIQFDPSLFKASSKSLSFPMNSMNIPLTYEDYLNHHQVLIILFYVIASLGLLQFLICLKTKNLVGVQTLQVLQFFFFVKLLTDDINPSLPYMNYPLFYANGFNFILSNQGRDYNMQMGMARLNIQPQFVLNLNISVLILLILYCVRLYYQISSLPKQTENTNKNAVQIKEQKEEKQKLKNIYQNFILPFCLISIFLLMFSMASKFNIRNMYKSQVPSWLECLTAMTAILSFFFVYFKQMKSIFSMPLLYSQQQKNDEQNDYDQNYVPFNILFYLSSAVIIISCKNQNFGIYIQGVICIMYLIFLFITKPYKQTYHNAGVILNQIVVICCFSLVVYVQFFTVHLTIMLIFTYGLTAFIFLILIFGFIRLYYSYKQRQEEYYKGSKKRQHRTKEQTILQEQFKQKRREQNPYLYENQLKAEQEQKDNSKQKLLPRKPNRNSQHLQEQKNKQEQLQIVKGKLKQSLRKKNINEAQRIRNKQT